MNGAHYEGSEAHVKDVWRSAFWWKRVRASLEGKEKEEKEKDLKAREQEERHRDREPDSGIELERGL